MQFNFFHKLTFWLSFIALIDYILDLGFKKPSLIQDIVNAYFILILILGASSVILRYVTKSKPIIPKVLLFDIIYLSVILSTGVYYLFNSYIFDSTISLYQNEWLKATQIIVFIREFSEQKINYKRSRFNPAQLFLLSFLLIILFGAFLLSMPNSTYDGIKFLDALFTSTSAVCVTGLIVVDTATHFTPFGQGIIMLLIQIGGLGILTFASYFSYFFKGGSTYENQLALNDITNSQKLSEVFRTLKHILVVTLFIESVSALIIFFSVNNGIFESTSKQVFFAIFHSVSAFCNAGFSTLSGNLYESGFSFNYQLQIIIMLTFVLGGLGFPIVVNIVNYIKYRIIRIIFSLKKIKNYRPWILTLNSRITLITTFSIMIVSFIFVYLSEYNHSLENHTEFGKIVNALFTVTTPRTAGFNTLDFNNLKFSTIMLIFLLMWIGASPNSTGGGIKTSTIAIAMMNIISLAKGKSRIEIFRREISDISVKRSYAVIALSLMVVGIAIFLISSFDEEKSLIDIAFECFSAYSTVGLSLGITSQLSELSKLVIIFVMFVGRVGMLSVFIAFIKKMKQVNYRYPNEEITIT